MPIQNIAWGRHDDICKVDTIRAGVAEFFATFFFVFIGEGSSLAFDKVSGSTTLTPIGLLIAALCHGFAIYAAIAISFNASGGHVNPAVTVGLLVGGNITIVKSILYIIAQLAGAALACLLLQVVTNETSLPVHALSSTETVYRAVALEITITFILLYTIYALAVDPKSKSTVASMPHTVGLIVAAIILFGAPYDGASMNPARSFGPALVSWSWENHWVYWVGPIVGGALGGIVYELIYMTPSPSHERLPAEEDY